MLSDCEMIHAWTKDFALFFRLLPPIAFMAPPPIRRYGVALNDVYLAFNLAFTIALSCALRDVVQLNQWLAQYSPVPAPAEGAARP